MRTHWRIWLTGAVLLLVMLACGPSGLVIEVTTTPSRPRVTPYGMRPTYIAPEQESAESTPPTSPNPVTPTDGSSALSGAQRQRLALATVHIALLKRSRGGYSAIGYGSGTILSPDGLILTNAHVANPASQGSPEYEPDALGIAIIRQEDEPPVATYLARVLAVDSQLDLAVLQITSYLDGSPVQPNDLQLPYVEVGDSDQVHLGDNLYIFGFPGIGGDTITFTRGTIAGFSSEAQIGSRAWIKTDATIAGGNSGGLAVDDSGRIVGVPTQASSGNTNEVADCRVVQDTNGDGVLNGRDTCIPIGGFINSLRPINLAKPLIRSAQANVGYTSPVSQGDTGAGLFTFRAWSADYDAQGCPTAPVNSFPSGADQITAVFSYEGLTDGQPFRYSWLVDGEKVTDDQFEWNAGSRGECFPIWLQNEGGLVDGAYTVLLYTGDSSSPVAQAEAIVGAVAAPVTDGVQVEGVVSDANSGRGIQGAIIIVLQPGQSVDTWLEDPQEDGVFSATEAGRGGQYTLPDLLQRGVRYEAAVMADGYVEETGYLEFDQSDGDIVQINVALNR